MTNPVRLRMEEARSLLEAGDLEAATVDYLWLWSHALEHAPSLKGVRLSYLAREAGELCEQHPPARAAFASLRDAIPTPPHDLPPGGPTFSDWVTLHEIIDERQTVLRWFDETSAPIGLRAAIDLEGCIAELLVAGDRWAQLSRLYPDPGDRFSGHTATCKRVLSLARRPGTDPEQLEAAELFAAKSPRELAGRIARSLRAAGRFDDLRALEDVALAWDAGAEMTAALAG